MQLEVSIILAFVWKHWKVAMAVGGGILWFVNLIIWIALAVIFGPADGMKHV